jgi:beta-mannosidase
MTQNIDLNSGWQLTWTEFRGEVREVPKLKPRLDAAVPGDVHLDLMRAGLLADPFVGTNSDGALWMEQKDWWYRREFETPPDLAGRRALLVFHGLDCFASVWVNGRLLGSSANMFMRHEFDATGVLRPGGRNELVVRLAAPAHSIRIDGAHAGLPTWSPERLFCRKAQMSFGWDIAPRLVTIGIWRPVELVLVDRARITDFRAALVRFEGRDALVRVEAEVEWLDAAAGEGRLSGTIGGTVWEEKVALRPGRNSFSREVLVRGAPRWMPIGYGKPALIEATAELESGGRKLDERRVRTGLRTIELVMEPQPSGATSFRFRVNGRDVFVTGLNWTPLDAIFARVTPERITAALESLAKIGCNMLRVWGGGVYESPHFYSECDRLGIMIWQDFMMACGWYPQTDEFTAALEAEARQAVRDLRGHPCIALWAGDNECDQVADWGNRALVPAKNRLTRAVLPRVCRELDPAVPFVPSSPWSPSGAHWSSQTEGDYHCYTHGQDYRKSDLWKAHPRFMSEFGRLSLPSMELIREYFPKGTEWPLTNAMWRFHGSDTTRGGIFRVTDKILDELKAAGRPEPKNIREAVKASQELQAEGVLALIEHYCSDPEFGGFLLWNVSDCWPQQSDAVTEYGGRPKPVFRKLGAAFRKARREADARSKKS